MSSERLARLVDFGSSNDMDSLLVTRHGRIVLEATYAPFRAGLKHRVNSVTKSVIGSLVAIALRDGRLDSTDQQVRGFLRRPHDRQPRRTQEVDHHPSSARHDIGPGVAGGPGWLA